ncbi:hypothetical protein MLD38_016285 [Melastoma candidum]|uniref:Uncharacterized protein n=1 Tax=Melastoma candidum TaxID=119954 RepID=A0ACB9RM13_9MYRT|nr:hypothetical protein MLD38_016285 [Melastoma candidum]
MDTPEKAKIASPIPKFEESPVFNYINNLSPIKPVKSIHVTQTFSSLTFATLPSIFASPQVNSRKESRFLKGHQDLDLENSKDSNAVADSDNGKNTAEQNENENKLPGNFDANINIGETSVDPVDESFGFVIELPQILKYDCASPDCDVALPDGADAECIAQQPQGSVLQQYTENHALEIEGGTKSISGQEGEPVQFSLDGSASKSTDVLIFSSPNDAIAFRGLIQTSPDISTGLLTSLVSSAAQYEIYGSSEMTQPLHRITAGGLYVEGDPSHLASEAGMETNECQPEMDECVNEGEGSDGQGLVPFDYKMSADMHRGMRRRCLDFEVAEPLQGSSDEGGSSSSSLLVQQSKSHKASKDKQPIHVKQGGGSKKRILPGIGLHLNALTSSSKNIKQETVLPDSAPQLSMSNQDNMNSMASENEMDPAVNGLQVTEYDPKQALVNYEEINQLSPRKRRRREPSGEPEACKRCNCKKSKCLKLYCECFAAGVYCIEPCACQGCFNKPIHEETVLATRKQIESRNPLAFAPKVIRASDPVSEIGDESNKTPASARHKRGCNCKKSNCLKKYCECYQGGVGCSINCRCEGCKNAFGTKDGSILTRMDCETEDDLEKSEMRAVDHIAWTADGQKSLEQNDSVILSTPSQLNRPSLPWGFPPKTKQLRSSLLNVGSSSSVRSNQRMGGHGLLGISSSFGKQPPQASPDDDIPDILCGGTPTAGIIKGTSPKGKRVSPPHSNSFSSSPGQRSGGRRLILRSIPSFPSLTPQH